MKKSFAILLLWLVAMPAASRELRIQLAPVVPLRSKYNVFERGGVARGQNFSVAITSRGYVSKIDDAGKIVWRVKSVCPASTGPSLDTEYLFYPCDNGRMTALSLQDGKQAWSFKFPDSVASRPVITADTVIFQSGDGMVYALNRADGKMKWVSRQSGRYNLNLRGSGQPLISGENLYVGLADGVIAKLKLENGDLLWKKKIFNNPITSDINFKILADKDSIYVSSREGICSIGTFSDKVFWCVDEQIMTEPVQNDNYIFAINSGNEVLSLDKIVGTVEKRAKIPESKLAKFEYERPIAIFAENHKAQVLFSKKLWLADPQVDTPKQLKSFPRVIEKGNVFGDQLYLITSKGYLEITTLKD